MRTSASSEPWTLISRYCLWLWILPFVYATVRAAINGTWAAAVPGGFALLFFLWQWFFCSKTVFVSFDETGLRLASLFRSDTVSWDDVQTIRPFVGARGGNPHQIKFRRRTIFGSRVYIIPPVSSADRKSVLSYFQSKGKLESVDIYHWFG